MRGVGHQHAVTARERQIGRQRRALVAALFLDDLDEQHLAALDDVLDLVAAAKRLALLAQFVGSAFVDRRAGRAGADLVVGLAIVVGVIVVAVIVVAVVAVVAIVAIFVVVIVVVIAKVGAAQPLFLGGMLGLFGEQGVAVGLGDLVVIGMDFAEREKAVAIAAVIDERRLQRRFDPRDLG